MNGEERVPDAAVTSRSTGSALPPVEAWDAVDLRGVAATALLREPVRLPPGAAARILDPDPDQRVVPVRSDWDLEPLNAERGNTYRARDPRAAAVLVGIVNRAPLTLLLTARAVTLKSHPGQIAFPGGKLDAGETAMQAALREADEEVGLAHTQIEPLGYLEGYLTGTGFHISPLVALIEPPLALKLDPREVADAFEVPLAFVMDRANHQRHTRVWKGRERQYYAMDHGARHIWGATAGIIRNLTERLLPR
ncbi:MAG: CoA pyrophosphatase [Pseudomonadota bacterium]